MRILMLGRGPIASVYGHVLEQAGHDIEFHVRPGRAAAYGGAVDLDPIDPTHPPTHPPTEDDMAASTIFRGPGVFEAGATG